MKPHTSHDRRAIPIDHNVSVFRFHPQDSLAGGPPARWFVIYPAAAAAGGEGGDGAEAEAAAASAGRSRRFSAGAARRAIVHRVAHAMGGKARNDAP